MTLICTSKNVGGENIYYITSNFMPFSIIRFSNLLISEQYSIFYDPAL